MKKRAKDVEIGELSPEEVLHLDQTNPIITVIYRKTGKPSEMVAESMRAKDYFAKKDTFGKDVLKFAGEIKPVEIVVESLTLRESKT